MSGQQNWPKPLHQHANTSHVLRVLYRVVVPVLLAVLAGCASKPTVSNASRGGGGSIPAYYTVKSGDTLSKIAARYSLDYRELARINNIDASYIIYTNQSIRLYDPRKGVPQVATRTTSTPAAPAIKSQSFNTPNTSTSITRAPTGTGGVSAATSSTSISRPVLTAPVLPASQPSAAVPANQPMPASTSIQWQWPADGPLLQQFDPATNVKGLRIGGKEGDTVRAAADGDVVYASNRLVEYGNLVLIRHVNGYVTAYAHNSKILVAENDKVRAGQKIAEMGSSGAAQTMLEFQIRLNGKPVNPLTLLAKK